MTRREAALSDVYGHLKSVMTSLGRQMEAELAGNGMSLAQMLLLYRLVERGSMTPNQISRTLGVTAGNITRLVDKLEGAGLVERTRSSQDLRVVHVRATRKGAKTIQGGFDAQAQVLAKAFADWSDHEVQVLRLMLSRLTARRARHDEAAVPDRSARKGTRPTAPASLPLADALKPKRVPSSNRRPPHPKVMRAPRRGQPGLPRRT